MNEYQQQILDHYREPLNYGYPDFDYTHSYSLENKFCGDRITVYLKIVGEHVRDVSFEGEGCSISIAAASLLYSTLKGKNIKDVEKVQLQEVLDSLGIPLTTARIKCANLPLETLQKAINSNASDR